MSDSERPQSESQSSFEVIRSHDYRAISSDVFRTRIGLGECTILVGKSGNTPNLSPEVNVLEEQIEVLVSWNNLKIFAMHLMSIVAAIEAELGPIPVPTVAMQSKDRNFNHHRQLVRSQQLMAVSLFASEPTSESSEADQQTTQKETHESNGDQ